VNGPARAEVIRTDKLTKVYPGGVKAVDGIDLVVHQGEIFGLLGPNGAGKTTTTGMLTTTVIPTSGQAWVGGIDVVAQPALTKQVIGVVPQTNTLDRALTVWENLYFHGRFFGMPAKEARTEADFRLEQFRLTDRAKMPVLALSGGMAQRLMVARSILHHPAILFLDEPTAGLDVPSRRTLWEYLTMIRRESGTTVFLTTHYLEEAEEADTICIIDKGKIVAFGSPDHIKSQLVEEYVIVDADDRTRLRDELGRLELPITGDGPFRVMLTGRGVHPVLKSIETPLSVVRTHAPSLEDAYLEIVGAGLKDE
jgi:ABC-2 type transport system ATP-binding protein